MRDDLERMAREAGCTHVDLDGDRSAALERLQRFAELVRADERERCASLANSMGCSTPGQIAAAIRNSAPRGEGATDAGVR